MKLFCSHAFFHAVVERPFPPNLSQEHVTGQDNGVTASTKQSSMEDSGKIEIETVLVNTNQFYKWFTDLEATMKSETKKKFQHYVNNLTGQIQTCDSILHQIFLEKQRLIGFAESLHIQVAIQTSAGGKSALSEGVEVFVIYVRFKAAAIAPASAPVRCFSVKLLDCSPNTSGGGTGNLPAMIPAYQPILNTLSLDALQ